MTEKQSLPHRPARKPMVDLSTVRGRARALYHLLFVDHGFLRHVWRNEEEIAPGVWRANQPGSLRIRQYARRGFNAVLTLRAYGDLPHQALTTRCVAEAGLRHYRHPLKSRKLVPAETLLELLDLFGRIERPFVMHCKSGADRTGLAAFLYLVSETDTAPAEARRQLSLRYVHWRGNRSGVLDHFAEAYVAAHAATGIGIRQWLATEYDHAAMQAEYDARRQEAA